MISGEKFGYRPNLAWCSVGSVEDPVCVGWAAEERRMRSRLARNVLARRKELGLTREAAAHEASMDSRHWAKVESGDHGVTLRTLAKLGVALRIDGYELLR